MWGSGAQSGGSNLGSGIYWDPAESLWLWFGLCASFKVPEDP